jgi:hypothetical protein
MIRKTVTAIIISVATLVQSQVNVGDGTPRVHLLLKSPDVDFIGTFYSPGLGSCGVANNASDAVVAVAWQTFDNYPYVGCSYTSPQLISFLCVVAMEPIQTRGLTC